MNNEELRLCPKCNRHLELDQFGSNASRKDGKQRYCFECAREIYYDKRDRAKERDKAISIAEAQARRQREPRINSLTMNLPYRTQTSYQRNTGHKHLQSIGLHC